MLGMDEVLCAEGRRIMECVFAVRASNVSNSRLPSNHTLPEQAHLSRTESRLPTSLFQGLADNFCANFQEPFTSPLLTALHCMNAYACITHRPSPARQ